MERIIMTIASESQHWYKKDGSPCYEVSYADPKKGMKATTWREAKKLDLVPGFSSIKGQLKNFVLDNWIKEQVLMSAYTCPLSRESVSAEEWLARVSDDAKEQGIRAREKGTEIHAIMERGLQNRLVPAEYLDRFYGICKILQGYGVKPKEDLEVEKSFARSTYKDYWFGGKTDIVSQSKNLIADIKTTEFTMIDGKPSKKLNWPEHILQLSAYGHGVGLLAPTPINIYISTISDDVYCHEWSIEEYGKAWNEFCLLTELWWIRRL